MSVTKAQHLLLGLLNDMARWHLDELKAVLEKRGWRIAECSGDDPRISGSWQMQHIDDDRSVVIEFDGLDGNGNLLPLHRAYACRVSGTSHSLYFSRRGELRSSARARWNDELSTFVQKLN